MTSAPVAYMCDPSGSSPPQREVMPIHYGFHSTTLITPAWYSSSKGPALDGTVYATQLICEFADPNHQSRQLPGWSQDL
jgi:hypothetical protein